MMGLMVLEDFVLNVANVLIMQKRQNRKIISVIFQKILRHSGRWKCNYCDFIAETRSELGKHKHELHSDMMSKNWPAWNKGLTKDTDERVKKIGEKYKQGLSEGKFKQPIHKWTPEEKERMSQISSEWPMSHEGSGFRDIPYYKIKNINDVEWSVRGSWELKIAEKLNQLNILWERNHMLKYSKCVDDKCILKNYNPDFYLPNTDEYIEVKGYYSDIDKEKMKLVKEHNPRHKD